jgi:hypothetical protein
MKVGYLRACLLCQLVVELSVGCSCEMEIRPMRVEGCLGQAMVVQLDFSIQDKLPISIDKISYLQELGVMKERVWFDFEELVNRLGVSCGICNRTLDVICIYSSLIFLFLLG